MNIENELAKRDAMIVERNERIKELEDKLGTDWLAMAKRFAVSGFTTEQSQVGILYALIAIAERMGK